MSYLPHVYRAILWMFGVLPVAFVVAYFGLPSERTLLVVGLKDAEVKAIEAEAEHLARVIENADRESFMIQDFRARVERLGPDETLWVLQPRSGLAGISTGDELDGLGLQLGERFTFERRPNRWASSVFFVMLLSGAVFGLLRGGNWTSTPPAR